MKKTTQQELTMKKDEILRQVREGEQKAQFQIYKYYFNTMYKTSLDIVKDEEKAEYAINEAFLKAFDKIENYNQMDNFGNWLKDIVVYQSVNQTKKTENKKTENQNEKNESRKKPNKTSQKNIKWLFKSIAKQFSKLTQNNYHLS
jgi:RNA polymerase sigma-70 factor (ECF subfamily)